MEEQGKSVVAMGYDAVYEALPQSATLRALWREHALGADFPEEFEHISFVTLAELRRMAAALQVGAGDTLADLGCGMGGPALWVARETGAELAGVDLSASATRLAGERAKRLGISARFVVGSFAETGLDEGCASGAMSEDAIQYAPDKRAVFAEAARILRPGGRLVFTAFELEPANVAGLPVIGEDPVADYRPLLGEAGFTVETYEETAGWRERLRETYESLAGAREALFGEMGPVAATAFFSEVTLTLEKDIYRGRVLAVAVRG